MAVSASAQFGDPDAFPSGNGMPVGAGGGSVPEAGPEVWPLLDEAALEELGEQLGGPDMARNFARDYAALWGQRQRRLTVSVVHADLAAALDAAVSLKVTSAMVGGSRLEHLARKMEAVIRKGDLQEAAALLVVIAAQGQATVEELQRRYGRMNG
jgi:hypothetical protein